MKVRKNYRNKLLIIVNLYQILNHLVKYSNKIYN
jgi:hypothetical protein